MEQNEKEEKEKSGPVNWNRLLSWGSPVGASIWLIAVGVFILLLRAASR